MHQMPFRPLRNKGEVPYFKNVEADPSSPDFDFEQENLRDVFAAMDELMRTPTLIAGSVMPDACPTGAVSMPVGGVVTAEDAIHPGFHSADICCSVMAANLGEHIDPEAVLNAASSVTHFGSGGRKRSAGIFKHLKPALIDRICSTTLFTENDFRRAQLHLGTQGDGNHFLFVGRSEQHGGVMVVTHHGSRAFGASLYATGMQIAERFRATISPDTPPENAWIPFSTDEGRQYWDALQTVREWTKLNHEVIHRMIAKKLNAAEREGVSGLSTFWNEHNFVFPTAAAGTAARDLFVHAEGATPMADSFLPESHDGLRLIPLNMGQPVLVVKGRSSPASLGFAPHGAGRNMTRTRHRQFRRGSGKTDKEIFHAETPHLDVRFWSGGIDIAELPSAYKNAQEVQHQIEKFNLGEIVDRIHPYGCIMAGC